MTMTSCERKQAQRARAVGYGLSRRCRWNDLGIDPEFSYTMYLEMIVAQKSACAICGDEISNKSPLDHDHKNGAVRGVLCRDCNLLLGKAELNKAFLRNAAAYL